MNQKLLRICLFTATIAVALFARSAEIRHSRNPVPVQVPLRLDTTGAAGGSFTPEKTAIYFVTLRYRSHPRISQPVGGWPVIESTVISSDKVPVSYYPNYHPYSATQGKNNGLELGRFTGQPGKRYTVAAVVKDARPDLKVLNPELLVTVSHHNIVIDFLHSFVFSVGAFILLLVSLGFLGGSLWGSRRSSRI